jgi:hypothetical protein
MNLRESINISRYQATFLYTPLTENGIHNIEFVGSQKCDDKVKSSPGAGQLEFLRSRQY